MEIEIRKPTDAEKEKAQGWPIWTCAPSSFDWSYSDRETCLILEGEVTVKAKGKDYSFAAGDWVVFPKGLSCVWNVKKAVGKHYKFG
jgi:uncharacterized cupin superfamily protein